MSRVKCCDVCGQLDDCYWCMECGQEMCRSCFGTRIGGDCQDCAERIDDAGEYDDNCLYDEAPG
jgi:hypothetical protein